MYETAVSGSRACVGLTTTRRSTCSASFGGRHCPDAMGFSGNRSKTVVIRVSVSFTVSRERGAGLLLRPVLGSGLAEGRQRGRVTAGLGGEVAPVAEHVGPGAQAERFEGRRTTESAGADQAEDVCGRTGRVARVGAVVNTAVHCSGCLGLLGGVLADVGRDGCRRGSVGRVGWRDRTYIGLRAEAQRTGADHTGAQSPDANPTDRGERGRLQDRPRSQLPSAAVQLSPSRAVRCRVRPGRPVGPPHGRGSTRAGGIRRPWRTTAGPPRPTLSATGRPVGRNSRRNSGVKRCQTTGGSRHLCGDGSLRESSALRPGSDDQLPLVAIPTDPRAGDDLAALGDLEIATLGARECRLLAAGVL
jgi:hypothetical protein